MENNTFTLRFRKDNKTIIQIESKVLPKLRDRITILNANGEPTYYEVESILRIIDSNSFSEVFAVRVSDFQC